MSNPVVDDLATLGRVEGKVKFVLLTLVSIALFIAGAYVIYSQKKYKNGAIFIGMSIVFFTIGYFNNYMIQKSSTYAAYSGVGDVVDLFKTR